MAVSVIFMLNLLNLINLAIASSHSMCQANRTVLEASGDAIIVGELKVHAESIESRITN